MSPLDEFGLIRRFFADRAATQEAAVVGIGDDAAVLQVSPSGQQLVSCIDTLVAGRHFPMDTPAADIGWKSLAVNLSDLAAMGAKPEWFQLALTLPEADEAWLDDFATGLFECANQHNIVLVGGDTTRGALSITVQAAGCVPVGTALLRSGAQPGDEIWVSGAVGGGALGLAEWPAGDSLACKKLARPAPRVALGSALRGVATAAIDISDGLLADLQHVLSASAVGAVVSIDAVPLFRGSAGIASVDMALTGGDDYELLFTLPAGFDITALLVAGIRPVKIGHITAGHELHCVDSLGASYTSTSSGWRHFE